eukprot:scaffold966_cov179-Skeletonema_dohrnii-CCMP3373.AAC.2
MAAAFAVVLWLIQDHIPPSEVTQHVHVYFASSLSSSLQIRQHFTPSFGPGFHLKCGGGGCSFCNGERNWWLMLPPPLMVKNNQKILTHHRRGQYLSKCSSTKYASAYKRGM